MKIQHTPGPWEIDGFDLTSIMKNEGSETWPQWKHIARCDYGYREPEKHFESNKANAKLIAAAPELLEALRYVVERMDNCDAWWIDCPNKGGFDRDIIESAINKATE